jgi:ribosomal-protein-alanine N-acetyltransferase
MENIILREFTEEDAEALLQMNIENKAYFERWKPIKPDQSYYTLEGHIKKIKDLQERSKNDKNYCFGVFLEESNSLIGNISFAFVQRGPLQTSMIGYEFSEKYTGRGYATKAVGIALDIAFNKLHFHRITAGAEPENLASLKVLEKAGFTREGYSPKSLNVDGEWRDQVCMAILNKEEV